MPTNGNKSKIEELEAEIGRLKEGFEERNPNKQQTVGERIADLEAEIERLRQEDQSGS